MQVIDTTAGNMPRSAKPVSLEYQEEGKRKMKVKLVNFIDRDKVPERVVTWNDEGAWEILPEPKVAKKRVTKPRTKKST
jgi:hypothetical protein